MSLLLGIYLNISFVEICILEPVSRQCITTVQYPETDEAGKSSAAGWWRNLCLAISDANASDLYDPDDIMSVGILSHTEGIILVDQNNALHKNAFIHPRDLLRVKTKEPKKYSEIHKIMLPGDFLAWKLTGEINTTRWPEDDAFAIDKRFIPAVKDNFSIHGYLKNSMVEKFGFGTGVPVSYKSTQISDTDVTNASVVAAVGAGIGSHLIIDPNQKYFPGYKF